MADIRDTVIAYLDALYAGDVTTARQYLAEQFSFTGPAVQFSDPDRYLRLPCTLRKPFARCTGTKSS